MTLPQLVVGLLAVITFLALLLAVALFRVDQLQDENRKLRRLVHPSTRTEVRS